MNETVERRENVKAHLLSRKQRRVLYQVLHDVQESSPYGFGDIFYVSGPSIDFLAFELGMCPHQIVDVVNGLLKLRLVSMAYEEYPPERTNLVCPNSEGWRQHPNFARLLPWIAGSEQIQDWDEEPEFEYLTDEQCDALADHKFKDTDLILPDACAAISDQTNGENAELRPQYFIRPTSGQLRQLASAVSPRSVVTCVLPGVGNRRFTTVAKLIDDLADGNGDGGTATITYRQDRPSQHFIEAAYVHSGRLYFVLDFYDLMDS